MKYIRTDWNIPYYNMAFEDYIMSSEKFTDDYLFFYTHVPSIMIGKHQNAHAEINQKFVKDRSIYVSRRISGGGAVYHDVGNLNFSYIFRRDPNEGIDFKKYTMPVIRALRQIGIESELSGRNDILIDGKKFSGNAQCMNKTKLLHHGTLMFDVTIEDLVEALNVSQLKIESKAIESVRSRVANLKDYLKTDMTIEEFKDHLIRSFYETVDFDEYVLTDEDKQQVQKRVDDTFGTWEYNFGKSPEFALNKKKKYDAGIVEAHLDIADGIIRQIKLYGDFFSLSEIGQLEKLFQDTRYEETAVRDKLREIKVETFIVNLTNDQFTDLLFY